jgi:hypothetical protein
MVFEQTDGVVKTVVLKGIIGDGLEADNFLFVVFELEFAVPENLKYVFHFGIEGKIELNVIMGIFGLDSDGEAGTLKALFHEMRRSE